MRGRVVLTGLCCAGLLTASSFARAETAELELRTLPESIEYNTRDYFLAMTFEQHFFIRPDALVAGPEPEPEPRFDSVVKKEPKYECKSPLKRVAKLGSYQYAFALDSTNLSSKGYDRLYLDRNRNGDLTDDEPIKAKRMDVVFGGNYRHREFPSQTLDILADGKTFQAPCRFTASSNTGVEGELEYASASLRNATYRQGRITIDGKPRRIFLLDHNNNGRFDDVFRADQVVTIGNGLLYLETGDMVLVDPEFKKDAYSGYSPVDSGDRQYLSKLLSIEGRYYRISVTPAGDKMTIEPAGLPTGALASDNGPYRAVLYGEQGLIKITGEKGRPAVVPVGEWKLLEYQIDLTDVAAGKPQSAPAVVPEKATLEKTASEKSAATKESLGERLAKLFGAETQEPTVVSQIVGPKYTIVRARATDKFKPVKVAEGKTETLTSGPPYKPVVSVSYVDPKTKEARLEMKLVGVAGEVCETLMVKGAQPPKPTFRILNTNGELVKKGQFEYG